MRENITPAEREILQYVLENAPMTVRTAADHVGHTKELARTTALTVMEKLRQKGHLKREASAAGYLYSPGLPKAEMQRNRRDTARGSGRFGTETGDAEGADGLAEMFVVFELSQVACRVQVQLL